VGSTVWCPVSEAAPPHSHLPRIKGVVRSTFELYSFSVWYCPSLTFEISDDYLAKLAAILNAGEEAARTTRSGMCWRYGDVGDDDPHAI
jgi:hypothetical protein